MSLVCKTTASIAVCTIVFVVNGCGSSPSAGAIDASLRLDATMAPDGNHDAAVDSSARVFDVNRVIDVKLTLSPAAIAALTADPRTYVSGDLLVDGVALPNVGVRLKGLRSFCPIDGQCKPAFKIDLNRFAPGQSLFGLTHLTLNNSFQDRSFLHETIYYQLARSANLPAPRTGFVQLTLNGELYGLYINVETEDKVMLRRWFTSDDGDLYEGNLQDLNAGTEASFDKESGVDGDNQKLAALLAATDQTMTQGVRAAMMPHMDVDQFLRFSAIEGVGGNSDGHSYGYGEVPPNNYRMYAEPGKWFKFLPWGADVTLTRDTSIMGYHGKLMFDCAAQPACAAEYKVIVRETVTLFESLPLRAQAEALRAVILPAVQADPRRLREMNEFEVAYGDILLFISERPTNIRAELAL